MSLLKRFTDIIEHQNLFSVKDKLLLAVSGGVDSVVMCELCHQAGYEFAIVHCNFQLRGQESTRDEEFVRELGKKYGRKLFYRKFLTEEYARENKISIQEAAREIRYDYFNLLISEQAGQYVLTAHHGADNAETILMNFCRGTGLHGLTGIPASVNRVRRPILSFSKMDVLQFANENHLQFVEDSSNQSSKYTRNLFRNEIIPLITKAFPQVNQNLQDNIIRFREIEKLYKLSVGEIKKKLCRQKRSEVHIAVKQLIAFNNRALIYEIIAEYGFSEKQVDEVLKLAASDSGKYIQSPSNLFRIIRHRHWFIISPAEPEYAENIIIEPGMKKLEFEAGKISFSIESGSDFTIDNTGNMGNFDMKNIEFPLLLRKWKKGDYFYPLGMKKKKKLARFFIDQKLSKTTKEKTWLLEANRKIVWVLGQRIDDRFKVTGSTKKVLSIMFIPAL